jgi:hypothetical protein
MDNRQLNVLVESIAGIIVSQSVLAHHLVGSGIIKREEIGLTLDLLIEKINKQHPNNNIVHPLKSMRESINNASPFQFPDWLQDITGQGDEYNNP